MASARPQIINQGDWKLLPLLRLLVIKQQQPCLSLNHMHGRYVRKEKKQPKLKSKNEVSNI